MLRILVCIIVFVCAAAPAMSKGATTSRACLTHEARQLLDSIEQRFGPVTVVSTCRPGATVRGTGRPSRHASGNAIDFKAGDRKAAVVAWLAANHRRGGTMTYRRSAHIHVDIGPRFVSLGHGGARKFRNARARLATALKPRAVAAAHWVSDAFTR